MSFSDPLQIVKKVADVLESLGIRYLVGGSLASSLHGIPRATQDADIVADLTEKHLGPLSAALSPGFYFDDEMAKDAVRNRASFNIIEKESLFKVDIFILKTDSASFMEMERRVLYEIADADSSAIYICSPEDIIAQKLYWFKSGGGVSERQWRDAMSVIKVQGKQLDRDYLIKICKTLGVYTLLDKALEEQDSIS